MSKDLWEGEAARRMKTYDYIIGYEHKHREVESICLLKAELESRGFSVFVYCIYDPRLFRYVRKYKAKILIVPFGYDNSSFYKCVRQAVDFDKVINLQWEQAIYKQQEESSRSFKNPSGICLKAIHISWGRENQKRLVQVAGVSEKNVRLAGNMTLDFLKKPLTQFYLSREELFQKYDIPDGKKICLLIASFKSATLSDGEVENLCRIYGSWRREHHLIARKTRDTILEWIERALNADEDLFFIYRPHPAEDTAYVSQIARRCDRFVVIDELSVKQWILAVDKIYTWMSTSVAEVYFSGKDCFILYPYELPEEANARLFDHAGMIKGYDGFYQSFYRDNPVFPIPKQDINDYYLADDGMSYMRVADVCEEVYRDEHYKISQEDKEPIYALADKPKTLVKRLNSFLWRIDWVYHLFYRVIAVFPNTDYSGKWIKHKESLDALFMTEYVSDDEMEAIGRRIKECLER